MTTFSNHQPARKRIGLVLVAGVLLSSCGGGDAAEESPGGEAGAEQSDAPDVVNGTYSAIAAYAPLFVAMEEGFFAKHGIDNQMDEVRINEALPLVASGEYDWGRSENGPGWFNALNSGLNLYGVVDRLTYTCSADNSLVVTKELHDSGVDTFEELSGKSIGIIAPGTQADYWLAQLLEEHDMVLEDVKVVNLNYPDQLAAMSAGNLDAAFMLEPLLTEGIRNESIVPITSMLDVTPGANIGTMFFGGDFIDREDGDVAVRWLAGWLEGARFAQDAENRDATLEAVQKWTDMEMGTLEAIYDGEATWPQVNVNGFVDASNVLETQAQFMLDNDYIDALPEEERVFRGDLVEQALEIVGEVDNEASQLCAD